MSPKYTTVLLFFSFHLLFGQVPQKISDTLKITPLQPVYISSFHINDSLLHAPAAIGILSKNDLTRNNNSDISTAVNRIPGVLMQSANITTNRISIRGIGARTPYGTNKIRAFYGSIPLTSGDSETTIEDIDVENIQQVEIIKGPLSSVYGAGLGGAILIAPKLSGTLGQKIGFNSVHGSFGLMKNNLHYSLDRKTASLNISYHHLETDGWRHNSAYLRDGITVAGEVFRKPESKLTYFSNYTDLKAFIPSSIDRKTFDDNPRAAAFTWNASKGYKQYHSVLGGLGYDFKIGKIKNATSVFLNYKDNYETRPFDILRQYTFATGARTQFSGNFKIGILADWIVGAEYFNDNYKGKTITNLYQSNNGEGSLEGNQLTGTTQKRNFYNGFAQLRLLLSKKIEVQAGINGNKTHFTLATTFPSENSSSEKYSYDAIWSPQVSLLFHPDLFKTIYISASRGYSLPSVSETLTASGTINATIKPESGYNYEIGGKLYFFNKTLYAEIAAYRMQIMDLLVAKRIDDDQYVGINAGETLHQGIELLVNHQWQIDKDFSVYSFFSGATGKYEFKDFVDSGNDFSGNKLTGVPANKANAGITIIISRWYVSADFLYVDKIPLNDSNSVDADAYKTLNVKTGYRFEILKQLESHLAFGINNITNEHYASLILPNAVTPPNGHPRYYYPGLPINYYATIALHYSF